MKSKVFFNEEDNCLELDKMNYLDMKALLKTFEFLLKLHNITYLENNQRIVWEKFKEVRSKTYMHQVDFN